MLGTDVTDLLGQTGHEVIKATYPIVNEGCHACDLTCKDSVQNLIANINPDVVFNCAAYTNVDGAEENEDLACAVNGLGAGYVARACKATGSFLLHVSTDYVFDGQKGTAYSPSDPVGPINAYGRSKYLGEKKIAATGENWAIVRTSWLFGPSGHNFVRTITSLAQERVEISVVNDQTGCPTYSGDLAKCLIDMGQRRLRGLWHFCNGPACSWYDLACKAVALTGLNCQIKPCGSGDFPQRAQRPVWSVLNCEETFKSLGWCARPWEESLADYFARTPAD